MTRRTLGAVGFVTAVAAAAALGYLLGYRAGWNARERAWRSEPTGVIRQPARAAPR